jgi:hypothetical protein
MRKSAFVMFAIAVMLMAGAASAADWQKVGKKTVVFGNTEETASITAKENSVSQVAFKVSGDWVGLNQVTLNFSDGSTQTLEDVPKVRPGSTSEAFSIKGGPKTISSIDFSYKAVSSSSLGRATVIVLGQ